MYLWSASHAVPESSYTQGDCLRAFQASRHYSQLSRRSQALLNRILGADNGIRTRRLALSSIEDAFVLSPDVLHQRFVQHAPKLACDSASRAIEQAGLHAEDIDGLVVSTCTGYLCPGLTSYISPRIGIRRNAIMLDLVGHGCGAAIPNLRTAHALIKSGQAAKVVSVCVEICSAAFYIDNDPGVLISACLFGDGAGAVVCSDEPPGDRRRVEWVDSSSYLRPEQRDSLRFEHRNGMLRNILSPETPVIAAESAQYDLKQMLEKRGLEQGMIQAWITHAGGKRVLEALVDRMGLNDTDLSVSRELLSDYGNISSPFVLLALERHLQLPSPSGFWWMNSFGAGFSSHGILLKAH